METEVTKEETPTAAPAEKPPVASPVIAQSVSPLGIGTVALVAFFVAMITTSAVVVAYDYFLAQKIVTVDMKGYLMNQQTKFISGQITEDQLKASFAQMDAKIKSTPKNRVVVVSDVVVSGASVLPIDGAADAKK